MKKLFDLSGQVALVTGGSRGLGRAIAEGLASAGADVAILSRTQDEAASVASQTARDHNRPRSWGLGADVADEASVQTAVESLVRQSGSIDILVNSAGINIRGPIESLSLAQFQQVQRVNVEGSWLVSRAVIPHMKKRQTGRIIHLASTLGVVGLADRTPYAASKGAVVQMTRAMALELAPWAITVNAICPGPFLTDMNIPIKDDPATKQFIIGAVALGRWGELHEVQAAAIYLAGPGASYTTGSLLMVDGGWTAR
jgi:NAD(P)-dependent dehydrogenase (short-subunit alcohol dehydrogenase family)